MTIRLRIALALAASFLIAGAVVLAIGAFTYQEAVYQSPSDLSDELIRRLGTTRAQAEAYIREHPEVVLEDDTAAPIAGGLSIDEAFQDAQHDAQDDAVMRARMWALGALALFSVIAAFVGWFIAGRALRPLRTITERARAASATDLGTRVALGGPSDEVRELGDTFDEMLERLERAFRAQRRFSSQVSHEIRTPLAIIASETELLLADARPAEQNSLEQIRRATDRAEKIVERLLVLSRSASGDLNRVALDLDIVTGDVLGEIANEAGWRELRVDLGLEAAPVHGDRALLERLVANLLSNAVRHNRSGGWIDVRTWVEGQWSVLQIENSVGLGKSAPGEEWMAEEDPNESLGIGLTVVEAVLEAHGGQLVWTREERGSVRAVVRLPVADARRMVGASEGS